MADIFVWLRVSFIALYIVRRFRSIDARSIHIPENFRRFKVRDKTWKSS